MKVWAVTYGDGYEFSGVIVEVYDDMTIAELRAMELQEKRTNRRNSVGGYSYDYGGYSVEEFELNSRNEGLEA